MFRNELYWILFRNEMMGGLLEVRCLVMLLDVCLRVVSLLIKAPAAAGAFYFFNSPTNPINQPPIPDTITPLNIMNDSIEFLCYY